MFCRQHEAVAKGGANLDLSHERQLRKRFHVWAREASNADLVVLVRDRNAISAFGIVLLYFALYV